MAQALAVASCAGKYVIIEFATMPLRLTPLSISLDRLSLTFLGAFVLDPPGAARATASRRNAMNINTALLIAILREG